MSQTNSGRAHARVMANVAGMRAIATRTIHGAPTSPTNGEQPVIARRRPRTSTGRFHAWPVDGPLYGRADPYPIDEYDARPAGSRPDAPRSRASDGKTSLSTTT